MKLITFTLLILFTSLSLASAKLPQTVFLEDLTWTELRDQIQSGKTTIIIPIGGTEQNGPNMALGKHNIRVKILAEKIALSLGNALVAPVLAYVPEGSITHPTAHLRFPGTITIPNETFEKTLEYAARSFNLYGFQDIVFLGDHGGYQREEQHVADRLNRAWAAMKVRVHAVPEYYQAAQVDFVNLLLNKGYPIEEIGSHAGLADTSLMLALNPNSVRIDLLKSSPHDATNGVYGDPQHATAELGQLGVDLITNQTVKAIRKAQLRPTSP
jgi:creatinine amidohydrolase